MTEVGFKTYKEKQNYYKEKYTNRGNTLHTSKIVNKQGKVAMVGSTYTSDRGDARRFKRRAREENK